MHLIISGSKDHQAAIQAHDEDVLEEMVYGSCLIKKNVVETDPKEQGIRAYLNFGHTIGHAIEKMSDFSFVSWAMRGNRYAQWSISVFQTGTYHKKTSMRIFWR